MHFSLRCWCLVAQRSCHVVARQLPCGAHAIPMPFRCWCLDAQRAPDEYADEDESASTSTSASASDLLEWSRSASATRAIRPVAPLAHLFCTSPTFSAGWATACSGAAGDARRQQRGPGTNPLLERSAPMKLARSPRRTVQCIGSLLSLKHRRTGSCCPDRQLRLLRRLKPLRHLRPLRQALRLMPDFVLSPTRESIHLRAPAPAPAAGASTPSARPLPPSHPSSQGGVTCSAPRSI